MFFVQPDFGAFMKVHLLLMLPFVLIPGVVISESAPSEAQLALLGEEYNTMRQMYGEIPLGMCRSQ